MASTNPMDVIRLIVQGSLPAADPATIEKMAQGISSMTHRLLTESKNNAEALAKSERFLASVSNLLPKARENNHLTKEYSDQALKSLYKEEEKTAKPPSAEQLADGFLTAKKKADEKTKCHQCSEFLTVKERGSSLVVIAKKCGNCKKALYCGEACQRMAWPKHKEICKIASRAK